jgi:uncharacterized membrane protein YccF (DUF307 family)
MSVLRCALSTVVYFYFHVTIVFFGLSRYTVRYFSFQPFGQFVVQIALGLGFAFVFW